MTRRILAGFLSVLITVIAAVIVPLGLTVTAQQRRDFIDGTQATARAIAALAEEHLDDKTGGPLPRVLSQAAGDGDAAVILDAAGTVVAATGAPLPAGDLAAARTGAAPSEPGNDRIVISTPVGNGGEPVGWVVLARSTAMLQSRARALWVTLAAAASAAVAVGAIVCISLARWIGRPLTSLAAAAHRIGAGELTSRADEAAGPIQVRDVARAFNIMSDRVAALLQSQQSMTADVSHQLRTPLAALRLRLELLGQDAGEGISEDVAAMVEETSRLNRLLDGLLAVARSEAIVGAPEPAAVADIAADRIAAWKPVAAEEDITMNLEANPAAPAAMTAGHLEQILDNLLANAIDASPAGGRITVRIHQETSDIVLCVADTGVGMTPAQRAHAFDRFATDRADRKGAGLGLAIVGHLVAANHGIVALLETSDGGLSVELRLPALREGVRGTAHLLRTRSSGQNEESVHPDSSAPSTCATRGRSDGAFG